MTNQLPTEVSKVVKAAIYKAADEAKYIAMSRTDSGKFMDDLVRKKTIGGVLENYIPKQQIRHYIKDGVLNRYSKDKACESFPDNLTDVVKTLFKFEVIESENKNGVTLFRSKQNSLDGKYVIVSTGTFLKWETALRKSLFFIASNPFSNTANSLQILLILYAQGKIIPPSDKILLDKALNICNAKAHIVGE